MISKLMSCFPCLSVPFLADPGHECTETEEPEAKEIRNDGDVNLAESDGT